MITPRFVGPMFFIKMDRSWQGLSLIPSQGFGVILIHFNKPADSRLQKVDSVNRQY